MEAYTKPLKELVLKSLADFSEEQLSELALAISAEQQERDRHNGVRQDEGRGELRGYANPAPASPAILQETDACAKCGAEVEPWESVPLDDGSRLCHFCFEEVYDPEVGDELSLMGEGEVTTRLRELRALARREKEDEP